MTTRKYRVRTVALNRAAEILGGRDALRRRLNVSTLVLGVWLAGAETPPADVFLKAVDIIETYKTSLNK
jgi:hypothetical protein